MAEERTPIRVGTVVTTEPAVPDGVADILIDAVHPASEQNLGWSL